jgi:membrane associated rhomboid family serine protease
VTPVVQVLLVANIAMWVLQITLPGLTYQLVFIPREALSHPWTVVTYMFLHATPSPMHLIFNMFALFFFGPRVEDRMGSKRFTTLYFLSGFSGALLSTFFSNSPIVGASAAVFGVMLAFAHYWPTEPIMIWGVFPVPARVLVIGTTVLAVFGGFTGASDGIAHFAHLGGYVGAWLYMRWLDRARTAFKRKATAASPQIISRLEGWKSIDLSKVHQVNRDEVSRLIEKVKTQGVGSLTGPERVFLSGFVPKDQSASTSP